MEKQTFAEQTLDLNEMALAFVAEMKDEIGEKLPILGAHICDLLARNVIDADEKDVWTQHVADLIRFQSAITEIFSTMMQVHSAAITLIQQTEGLLEEGEELA
jgi:hypothetical protein